MKKLEVRLTHEPDRERVVGHLAEAGRQVVFEYDPAFLRDPLWLSPFKLSPEHGLVEHRDHAFGPVFGLFDDSLPDGWGLLLMERFFQQQGSALAEVSVPDRLAYLGTRTMGALTYHPPADPADRHPRILDLHEMAHASAQVIRGTTREVLPQLLRAGGGAATCCGWRLRRASRAVRPKRLSTRWQRRWPDGLPTLAKRTWARKAPGRSGRPSTSAWHASHRTERSQTETTFGTY